MLRAQYPAVDEIPVDSGEHLGRPGTTRLGGQFEVEDGTEIVGVRDGHNAHDRPEVLGDFVTLPGPGDGKRRLGKGPVDHGPQLVDADPFVVGARDGDAVRHGGDRFLQRRRPVGQRDRAGHVDPGRQGTRDSLRERVERHLVDQLHVEVLGVALVPHGQGETEADLGPRREALGERERELLDAERALERPRHIAVGDEAHLASLREADTHREPCVTAHWSSPSPARRGTRPACRRRG